MLQHQQEVQLRIKRSLDRLTETLHIQNAQILLPALTFATKLLENYANVQKNDLKTSYYQMVMAKLIDEFQKRLSEHGGRQFTNLSKNKKKIVADLLKYLQKYKNSSQQYTFLQSQEQKDKKNKLDSLIKDIYQYFEEHNLDKAYQRICQLNSFPPSLSKQILIEEHQKKFLKIEKQYQKMSNFYSEFTNSGWILDKEQKNMKMYYKVYQQQKTISVKIEAELELEMLPFLAIINQIELHYTYVPFTYQSNIIKILGRNKKAAYSKVYVPFLTDRECYYYAVGYDRMATTQSIFVYGETYDEDLQMQREYSIQVPPAEQSQFVRLKVDYFCMEYKPISKTRAKVVMMSKANFKLTFLPLFILQKSARIFTFDYFNNIVKNAKNYKGSEFEKRVIVNPSLYNFFQSKVDQYLK